MTIRVATGSVAAMALPWDRGHKTGYKLDCRLLLLFIITARVATGPIAARVATGPVAARIATSGYSTARIATGPVTVTAATGPVTA